MSDTVLLAVDGSPGSERALQYVIKRALADNAKVVVAYVIEWSAYSFNTPEENAERHVRKEQEIARASTMIVAPVSQRLQSDKVLHETVVRHGAPAQTLVQLAKEHSAAQIVIGRRGQSSIETLLFGSVAGKLVQTAPIPVVVVP